MRVITNAVFFSPCHSTFVDVLQEACRERGMRATGLTKQGYVRQLSQWLDLRQETLILCSVALLLHRLSSSR